MKRRWLGLTIGMVAVGLMLASPAFVVAQGDQGGKPGGAGPGGGGGQGGGAAVARGSGGGGGGGGGGAAGGGGGGGTVGSASGGGGGGSVGSGGGGGYSGGSSGYSSSVASARQARGAAGSTTVAQPAPAESRPRGTAPARGVAVPNWRSGGDSGASGGRTSAPDQATAVRSRSAVGAPAAGRAVPSESRPRGTAPVKGTAVPRGSAPPGGGGGYPVYPGYYPPGWGGYYPGGGWGGYYPWWGWGWGFGLSWYYDPFWFGYGYPGYWGGYPSEDLMPVAYSDGGIYYTGNIKLKIRPKNAEVYVDGYYVGIVDDFDGMFQDLKISADPSGRVTHKIDIRALGAQTLSFEVRLQPGQTITYRGELLTTSEPKR